MPDEDSDVEKLSPLLEVGISFENDVASHIEISITDRTNESSVSKKPHFGDNHSSIIKQTSLPENINQISSSSCSVDAGENFCAINIFAYMYKYIV